MIPPIDDAILQSNPKFAALHKTLSNNILNPDGSTKHHPAQAERDVVAKELQTLRIRETKTNLLKSSLATLPLVPTSPKEKPLQPDVIELIILLTHTLSNPLTPDTASILASDSLYASLPRHIPTISALLSSHLQSQALPLARVLCPTTNTSFLHRQIPSLPTHLLKLTSSVSSQKLSLQTSRAALVPLTNRVLAQYRHAIELVIRCLEQVAHGQASRASKTTSELLSLTAQKIACETQLKELGVRNAVYSPEVKVALRVYAEHLRDARDRLRQREKEAKRELARYGVGRVDDQGEGRGRSVKEKTMREVGRVYGEMMEEVEEVRKEIARLKGS